MAGGARPLQAASQAATSSIRPSDALGLSALANNVRTLDRAASSADGRAARRFRKSSKGVVVITVGRGSLLEHDAEKREAVFGRHHALSLGFRDGFRFQVDST